MFWGFWWFLASFGKDSYILAKSACILAFACIPAVPLFPSFLVDKGERPWGVLGAAHSLLVDSI